MHDCSNLIHCFRQTPVQQILMDADGYILESGDNIFSTAPYKNQSALEWSSFVESIFEVLLLLKPCSPEIYFVKVETIDSHTTGIFDCSFLSVEWEENRPAILWTIYERSEEYLSLRVRQQQLNEAQLRSSKR